jgi:diguanylate cyclase (GGDEF)-like protein
LLTDKRLEGGRLLSRLREIRSFEGLAAFSEVVHLLAHVELTEPDAEELLVELLRHRGEMGGKLGRDPGLQVAAIDFLTHVRPLLTNPTVVELTLLDQTERFAITDPLTDLFNRRFFQSALDTEVRRSHRHSLELAVLMLDLDSFKSVNDVYGHPFGDRVLRRAGRVIRRSVRESDTACRFGGEEFCVILPETDRLGAFAAGERVRRGVENDFADTQIDGRLVAMTISGGVACFPEDGETSQELVDRADEALYRSKLRGRNRVVIHHAEKRRTTRYPVKASTRARLAMRPAGEQDEVRPLNLSTGGALLECARGYSRADAVVLTLESGLMPCIVPARVVRVEASDGVAVRRVAVEFERPMSASTLADFVVRSRPSWASLGGDA